MKKIKKLLSITAASILLFSCGVSQSSGDNNKKGATAAQQNAANKYQEFVLMYTQTCLKDFNVYGKDKAFWIETNGYVCIIIGGTVRAAEKSISAAASKAGTYDEANKQITVTEGDGSVTYNLVDVPANLDAYFESPFACNL